MLTPEERRLRKREYDRRYRQSEKGKEANRRYRQSEKGKEAKRRYRQSEKGKEAKRRYRQSEKCKENDRRYHQKYHCAPKWAWEFGGETAAKIYVVWRSMIERATVKTPAGLKYNPWYANCTVCDEWRDFKNFYFWSLANGWKPNPKKKQTIDRIDNEKGYCAANCRWTDWSTQNKNRRMTEKWRESNRRNIAKAKALLKAKLV